MVMMCGTVSQGLCRHYDDGPGWPSHCPGKERAFRQGFVAEARRLVHQWCDPMDDFGPWREAEHARRLRRRVRERYTVYGPGDAGRKTYHLGYRPGHAVPAARLRGLHHAREYVIQPRPEVADLDTFERLVLPAWLTAVEQWNCQRIGARLAAPPPRPREVPGAERVLRREVERRTQPAVIARIGPS